MWRIEKRQSIRTLSPWTLRPWTVSPWYWCLSVQDIIYYTLRQNLQKQNLQGRRVTPSFSVTVSQNFRPQDFFTKQSQLDTWFNIFDLRSVFETELKIFLGVSMGPRGNRLKKNVGQKSCDTVSLNLLYLETGIDVVAELWRAHPMI
jgi:hypothetical protein